MTTFHVKVVIYAAIYCFVVMVILNVITWLGALSRSTSMGKVPTTKYKYEVSRVLLRPRSFELLVEQKLPSTEVYPTIFREIALSFEKTTASTVLAKSMSTQPNASAVDGCRRNGLKRDNWNRTLPKVLRNADTWCSINEVVACVSRRHAYGGAWLASTSFYLGVQFALNSKLVQLEMASHDMYSSSKRALKADCVADFYVEHLSAYGRHIKNAGDDSNPQSYASLQERACDAKARSCSAHPTARTDVLALVPFYSGNVPSNGPHSFGTHSLRLVYLAATLCSIKTFFSGLIIIGVCEQNSDRDLVQSYLEEDNKLLIGKYRVEQLDCSSMTNNLPSQLLSRGQQLIQEISLKYQFIFFTESDHVVSFASAKSLDALMKHLDNETYVSPFRLEETYFKRRRHFQVEKYAARQKDTTGLAYETQGKINL
mmetsp:Transcript_41468/g.69329  ORF Transcript_41468/g.69329 Transcript_41468/m.69329 type:complete len:428 (-) Transcript_41468:609-1892(-)